MHKENNSIKISGTETVWLPNNFMMCSCQVDSKMKPLTTVAQRSTSAHRSRIKCDLIYRAAKNERMNEWMVTYLYTVKNISLSQKII